MPFSQIFPPSPSPTESIRLFYTSLSWHSPFFFFFCIVQSLSHVWLFPSLSHRACSNSHPLGQWCHPTISSSVIPFSSCLQSSPTSGSFLMSQLLWPNYWRFSFSISPSDEYLGLISFTIHCGKFWKRWEYQTTWSASWEICMQVRKQQLELDMEQQTGS